MIYGETNEIPLSLKGFRLMVNYWYHLNGLPDYALAKKALLENITLRTNWIRTIEKVTNWYNLTNLIDNPVRFKNASLDNSRSKFINAWKNAVGNPDTPKVEFYKTIKKEFKLDKYLELPNFRDRQVITKFKCSDHQLEIERGRYTGTPRPERLCKLCTHNAVETEEHFLMDCPFYNQLREKHNLSGMTNVNNFMDGLDPVKMANYLKEAFENRQKQLEQT